VKNAQNKSISKPLDSSSSEAEELGRLLGVIAHEIKNPLSTIKVNLRLIDEELSASPKAGETSPIGGQTSNDHRAARARRKLAIIDKEAARLEQILDGFLRYADRTQPRLFPVDLNSIVSDIFDFYLPQAAAHSITMRQGLHKEPLVCRLDAGMLKQAILNLFINAQQAMDKQGELMVRTSRQGDYAVIQISDTGQGIPADRLDHIFEPYRSTRPNGSGLGLPTVKKVIDAHKGTITVVSEPGKGTAFTITLPICSEREAFSDE
jgi:signal transduction histidine kinase